MNTLIIISVFWTVGWAASTVAFAKFNFDRHNLAESSKYVFLTAMLGIIIWPMIIIETISYKRTLDEDMKAFKEEITRILNQ